MIHKEELIEQTKLQHEIVNKAGINIVTCENCGAVILHRTNVDKIKCFDCNTESEVSDFPDLFFENY